MTPRTALDPSRPEGLAGAPAVELPGTGGLVVAGAIGYFECRTRSMSAEGDHILVIGEVTGCDVLDDRPPLLFVGGGMHRVGPRLDL